MSTLTFLSFRHQVSWMWVRGGPSELSGRLQWILGASGGRAAAERQPRQRCIPAAPPLCISLNCIFWWPMLGSGCGVCPSVQHKTHGLRSVCSFQDQKPTLRPFGRTGWTRSTQNLRIACPFAAFSLWFHTSHATLPCVAGLFFLAPCQVAHLRKSSLSMFPSCPVQPQACRLGLGPAESFHK